MRPSLQERLPGEPYTGEELARRGYLGARAFLSCSIAALALLPLLLPIGCGWPEWRNGAAAQITFFYPCLAGVIWGRGYFSAPYQHSQKFFRRNEDRRYFIFSVAALALSVAFHIAPLRSMWSGYIVMIAWISACLAAFASILVCQFACRPQNPWRYENWGRVSVGGTLGLTAVLMTVGFWVSDHPAHAAIDAVCKP